MPIAPTPPIDPMSYEPLVRSVAVRCKGWRLSFEDKLGWAWVGAMEAIRHPDCPRSARPRAKFVERSAKRALNAALNDEYRRQPARGASIDLDTLEGPEPGEPAELPSCLALLTEKERATVLLRYGFLGGEHSWPEIGRIMGVTKSGAQENGQRAVARLREILAMPGRFLPKKSAGA